MSHGSGFLHKIILKKKKSDLDLKAAWGKKTHYIPIRTADFFLFFVRNKTSEVAVTELTLLGKLKLSYIRLLSKLDLRWLLGASLESSGLVVESPPPSTGNTGSIPALGKFHMSWSNKAREPQLLKSVHIQPALCNRSHCNENTECTTTK